MAYVQNVRLENKPEEVQQALLDILENERYFKFQDYAIKVYSSAMDEGVKRALLSEAKKTLFPWYQGPEKEIMTVEQERQALIEIEKWVSAQEAAGV